MNTDNALITTPGTYSVTFDLANSIYVITNVANLTLGAGGGAAGVQTFAITNLQFTFTNLVVTNGGVLAAQGANIGQGQTMTVNGGVLHLAASNIRSPLIVTNGGVVISANDSFSVVTVANGGVLNASGSAFNRPVTVTDGGLLTVVDVQFQFSGLTVAPGGEVDISHDPASIFTYTDLEGPLNNSGTINLTNAVLHIEGYFAYYGGLVNQPGGVINLQGSAGLVSSVGYPPSQFFGYIVNQGIINQLAGTNSISAPFFDNTLGTITNLSGTMVLGTYQTNLAGTYFAAAGATIQFIGANNATPLTTGAPFLLGGSGQYQFLAGFLALTNTAYPNLALIADRLVLGPAFQGGAITNLTLNGMELLNALPITGTLTTTNSSIATNLTVAAGGVLSYNYEGEGVINGTVTVAGGGVFNVINSSGSIYTYPLILAATVAHGGTMNVEGPTTLIYSLTNAGTLNLTAPINFHAGTNGILNQAGGLINLGTNGDIIIATPTDYFINRGTVVENAGAGATNTISYQTIALINITTNFIEEINIYPPFDFDNSQGTITNLSGTLVLPGFQSTLAGTFFAAAGATIQLGGGTAAIPLVAGTPLVLGGSGQYQFISGYLYLAANVIPNLSLQGGLLTLGAGFQGGAITNLILGGMTLTNTLPINGTFTIISSGSYGSLNYDRWAGFYGNGVYGNYTVAGGDVLTVSNAVMYGAVTVASGGVWYANYTSLHGALTVASGGKLNLAAGFLFEPGSQLQLFGPLTNAGTINFTNSALDVSGGVINQPGGLIDFWDNTVVGALGSFIGGDYLVNQGRIIDSSGFGLVGLICPFATNSGTITAQTGQMVMDGQWTLLSSGSLNVGLNSAISYGSFIISSNYPSIVGNAGLAGAFNVILNNGYVPTNGTTFNVLSYGSFTGSFTSLGLPSAVSWQSTYGSTNFTLVAGSAQPQFGSVNLSGTNLIFNGIGGSPGSNYVVLVSTNLTIPLTNWLALTTNTFDGTGQFHYTNNVNPVKPRQFFIFKLP
jgi:hypothetical protein